MMNKEEILKQVEEFRRLEKDKLKLDVHSLRKYLNLKRTLHQKFDLDKLRKLNGDDLVAYIETVSKAEESSTEPIVVEQTKEENKGQEVEPQPTIEVRPEVQEEKEQPEEITEEPEEKVEVMPVKVEEQVISVKEEVVVEEEPKATEKIDENEPSNEELIVEEQSAEKTIEEQVETIPETALTSDLHDILQENTEEIAKEVRKIRKKVQENIVEIDTGRNLSVQVSSSKIKITLPKSAEIKISHSLLLELYNKVYGFEEEEVKEIEATSEENELKLEEQLETETQEKLVEKLVEDTEEPIEKRRKKEVRESSKRVLDERTEEKVKKKPRKKVDKGCIKIPTYDNFINEWKSKDAPEELLTIYNSEKQNYEGKQLEEIVASILNLKYENGQICKTENFNKESIKPEHIYRLRMFGGLRFNAIIELLKRLLSMNRKEVAAFLDEILKPNSDEILDSLFGKARRKKIKE